MGVMIPILECILTILVVCLGLVAIYWVIKICARAMEVTIDSNIMMVLGAIGFVILLIVAVRCMVGAGGALIHLG